MFESFSFLIVCFGFFGMFYNKGNLVLYFMSLELLLLGVNLLFIFSSLLLGDAFGVFCALCLLTIAASEVSVGLGLLVSYYISQMDMGVNFLSLLSW